MRKEQEKMASTVTLRLPNASELEKTVSETVQAGDFWQFPISCS